MHDPERDIRDILLSQLELSPDNVRKTPADDSAFTELKASIAAHRLLENLIARSMEPGPDGAGRYAVIAGGRRLAAMQALAAEGALDENHPVPCRMIGSIVAAEEVSLAENSVRAAMHPADQVEAFRRLTDAGSTAAAIAARFGVSERTVEKRLRLGNAAPVLLEAYRAGDIDLETLMAFAVTTDQARQSAVWETVSQQGYRPGAWQIKRLLTEDRVPATSAIARFVGVETYEAAGGSIDRDLFAEEDERGCQRRSKISPPGRSKTSPLNVMRYAVLGGSCGPTGSTIAASAVPADDGVQGTTTRRTPFGVLFIHTRRTLVLSCRGLPSYDERRNRDLVASATRPD